MKVIYKYELLIADNQKVELSEDFEILTVQNQDGKLVMWVLIDPDMPECKVNVNIIGTGNPIYNSSVGEYISTVQMGMFVWHVFIG